MWVATHLRVPQNHNALHYHSRMQWIESRTQTRWCDNKSTRSYRMVGSHDKIITV